ncbi:hypothetical protein RND81_11G214100 [Saponaria officinalis]|uniref:LOB domain-containing protein n=1 Tax=Saponaria officinalis TaxID=3572 RepID=A0AAW1HQ08_SAPOF
MSCNGCRVLRKGCSETCMLRPCIQWIDTPESQGHATVFVAKFFGRAGLMSFISNVPPNQRPALFQSLLYEACGRTVNPVSGAVGLLWTGNWQLCQAAVETVLRGGTLRPIPEFLVGAPASPTTPDNSDDVSEVVCHKQVAAASMFQDLNTAVNTTVSPPRFTNSKRRRPADDHDKHRQPLDLSLTPPSFPHAPPSKQWISAENQRPGTPSFDSEESAATVSFESGRNRISNGNGNGNGVVLIGDNYHRQFTEVNPKLLDLFV